MGPSLKAGEGLLANLVPSAAGFSGVCRRQFREPTSTISRFAANRIQPARTSKTEQLAGANDGPRAPAEKAVQSPPERG